MIQNIPIKRGSLSQKELNIIIEDKKNTINLTGVKSEGERIKRRKQRIIKQKLSPYKEIIKLFLAILLLFGVIVFTIIVYGNIEAPPNSFTKKEIKINNSFTKKEIKINNSFTKKEIKINNSFIHKTDGEIIKIASNFISKFEGMHNLAYYDHKQWSICYGTKSYRGEIVSKENCKKRLEARVKTELLRINRLADNLAWNKKVALVSFMYNTGYNYKILHYAKRGDDKSVIFLISQYNSASGKWLKGLQKRRNKEIKMYINN